MKITLLFLTLCSLAYADPPKRIEIDFEPPKVDNEFSRSNPHYKQRAGSFYERQYLPGTANYLFEVCSVEPNLHPYMMEILRAFIYDWCDAYTRGGGKVNTDTLAHIVRRMDGRILALLDEGQKERYPAWRNTNTGKNSMRFLIDPIQHTSIPAQNLFLNSEVEPRRK